MKCDVHSSEPLPLLGVCISVRVWEMSDEAVEYPISSQRDSLWHFQWIYSVSIPLHLWFPQTLLESPPSQVLQSPIPPKTSLIFHSSAYYSIQGHQPFSVSAIYEILTEAVVDKPSIASCRSYVTSQKARVKNMEIYPPTLLNKTSRSSSHTQHFGVELGLVPLHFTQSFTLVNDYFLHIRQ